MGHSADTGRARRQCAAGRQVGRVDAYSEQSPGHCLCGVEQVVERAGPALTATRWSL